MQKQLVFLLEPAEASSLDLGKDDSHIGLQIARAQMLAKELAEVVASELYVEKEMLHAMIEDRFGRLQNKRIYGSALFLDPRFKDRRVEDSAEFRLLVKKWFTKQYQQYSEVEAEQVPDVVESSQEEPAAKKPISLFAREKITEVEPLPTPNTWIEKLAFETVSYNAENTEPMSSDPLTYWQKNVVRFPILSKVARRYLSAPSTSVASEQFFSHAREIFHYKRGQLDPNTAEKLIFLNEALEYVNF